MSGPTNPPRRPQPAMLIAATGEAHLTPDEKRVLAAYRAVPASGNNRETILLVVEKYAELCPRNKRPALHLVSGSAA